MIAGLFSDPRGKSSVTWVQYWPAAFFLLGGLFRLAATQQVNWQVFFGASFTFGIIAELLPLNLKQLTIALRVIRTVFFGCAMIVGVLIGEYLSLITFGGIVAVIMVVQLCRWVMHKRAAANA